MERGEDVQVVLGRLLWAGWLLAWLPALSAAQGVPACEDCQLHVGLGSTYHFWGATGGTVVPATLTWGRGRYELGLFRMATEQVMSERGWRGSRLMAEPYWGVSASRRWKIAGHNAGRVYFGFGGSYKSEADPLNATRWNFASQLVMRVQLPRSHSDVEFSLRHWSNAGIRLPNRGQDFFTVSYAFSGG